MPKVSILIPIYNSENYLEKCIKSATSQSLKDIEIILINDGSIDSSIDIINKYSFDKRVKIINKDNTGYGASLNLAIKEAQGEYISILDADDFIDSDMLKTLYSHCGYDVIKCGFKFFPDNTTYNLMLEGEYSIDDAPEIINIKPSVWSAIYKKDFLIKNNIFFQESKGASYQDVAFQFKTQYCAKSIYFIDKPFYNYRTNNADSSVKVKNKVRAIINEFSEIDKFIRNKQILPETAAQLRLHELRAYIWNFKRISKFYDNEFVFLINKKLNETDLNYFFASKYIKFKEKLKMFILLKYPILFKFLLSIIKKYAK